MRCLAAIVAFTLLLPSTVLLAQTPSDIEAHPFCKYCNMNRLQYAHGRMLITYDDGSSFGACSIHCAAIDLVLNVDKTPTSILVGDYVTKALIDAETAYWVIGGNRPGVMTRRAKWAFASKADAQRFITFNGGKLASFDAVMRASYEDMQADSKMIRNKRKLRKMQDHPPAPTHPSGAGAAQPW